MHLLEGILTLLALANTITAAPVQLKSPTKTHTFDAPIWTSKVLSPKPPNINSKLLPPPTNNTLERRTKPRACMQNIIGAPYYFAAYSNNIICKGNYPGLNTYLNDCKFTFFASMDCSGAGNRTFKGLNGRTCMTIPWTEDMFNYNSIGMLCEDENDLAWDVGNGDRYNEGPASQEWLQREKLAWENRKFDALYKNVSKALDDGNLTITSADIPKISEDDDGVKEALAALRGGEKRDEAVVGEGVDSEGAHVYPPKHHHLGTLSDYGEDGTDVPETGDGEELNGENGGENDEEWDRENATEWDGENDEDEE